MSYVGTNATYEIKTSKKCGRRTRTKKELMKLYQPDVCPHQTADNRGPSKTTSRTFCLQCTTFISEIPQQEKHEKKIVLKEMDTKSTPAIVDASRRLVSQEDMQLTKEEALICVERLGGYVHQLSEKIKPTELINALKDAIDVPIQRLEPRRSAFMAIHSWRCLNYKGPAIKMLRRVDIMADPSVWALQDEGCNTACHSKM